MKTGALIAIDKSQTMGGGERAVVALNTRPQSLSAPEVEILRDQLQRRILGKTVATIHVPERFLKHLPPRPEALLQGSRGAGVRRIATWLALDLDTGLSLVLALAQGGALAWREEASDGGDEHLLRVHFAHARTLLAALPMTEAVALVPAQRFPVLPAVKKLGPDVLSTGFSLQALNATLARARSRPLRSLLLDQRKIAGLDAWLADEILLRAGLHPCTPSGRLTPQQARGLFEAICTVLRQVLQRGGSAATGFLDLEGRKGTFEPVGWGEHRCTCPVCGTSLARALCGRRRAILCPTCQGLP
ncbi:MAG: hypothetical protein ONB30_04045 [candidate division KSB1 bacterium]|nr:hypothetical protein [candidate division KSB1 bacterium]